jgi:hypothetical protein
MPTDDPYWNDFREDADTFRGQHWEFRQYRSEPALYKRDGTVARRYQGEPYDPAEWEVREVAWDHEHCHFCFLKISDGVSDGIKAGYANGKEWLCPTCYQRIIELGENPEVAVRGPN